MKHSRSSEKRAALRACTSLAFGENLKKTSAMKSLRKLVNLNKKSISKALRNRESILEGDTASWLYTKRKVTGNVLVTVLLIKCDSRTSTTLLEAIHPLKEFRLIVQISSNCYAVFHGASQGPSNPTGYCHVIKTLMDSGTVPKRAVERKAVQQAVEGTRRYLRTLSGIVLHPKTVINSH